MQTRYVLLAFPSRYIVDYIAKHPIQWVDRELAKLGGDGDKAGLPPTPAVQEFIALLANTRELFTQESYWQYIQQRWGEWIAKRQNEEAVKVQRSSYYHPPDIIRGLRAKVYGNFYVPMIDALHAWALLYESGQFDRCVLDTYEDATGKSDITVTANGQDCRIALLGPKSKALECRVNKIEHRRGYENASQDCVIQMPEARPRQPGNKRWHALEDFAPVFAALSIDYFSTHTPETHYDDSQSTLFGRDTAYDYGH